MKKVEKMTAGPHKGEWRVRRQLVDPATQKRVNLPVQYLKGTKREADALWTKLGEDYLEAKRARADQTRPFIESFESYVDEMASSWTKVTLDQWKFTFNCIKTYFPKPTRPIKDIAFRDVRLFIRTYAKDRNLIPSKNGTLDRRLRHLRQFFLAVDATPCPVPRNPLKKCFATREMIKAPKQDVFTEDQMKALKKLIALDLSKLAVRNWGSRLFILAMLETGMRPEEVEALRWSSLEKDGSYYVFKVVDAWSEKSKTFTGCLKGRMRGESRLSLPISNETYKLLDLYREKSHQLLLMAGIKDNTLIFPVLTDYRRAVEGIPLGQASVRQVLKQLCARAGLSGTAHLYTCRHSVATLWANSPDVSYPWLAGRLGNSVPVLLSTYVHPVEDDKTNLYNSIYG